MANFKRKSKPHQRQKRHLEPVGTQAKPVICVEYCVEDALRRGLREESLFQSVMAQIHRPGVEVNWGDAPITNPFWHEHMTRDERGRKLSGRQIRAAGNRCIINAWEQHLLRKLGEESLNPEVFTEEANHVPLGTSKTLDGENGWDVTRAERVRRTPVDELLRDLEPTLRSLAKRARRALRLEEAWDDDLKQEARIKIATGLPSFEGRCAFTTWAYRVAWRAMVDLGRDLEDQRRYEKPGLEEVAQEAREEFAAVDDRLTLGPILREVFAEVKDADLIVLQQLGYQDAEISDENLRMRRHRARTAVAERLRRDPEIVLTFGLDDAIDRGEKAVDMCAQGCLSRATGAVLTPSAVCDM